MLSALRLPLATLAVLLISAPAAHAATSLSIPVPAEGRVAVALAGGAKGVKVKSAPAGVTVAGGVKKGRLAIAVVRPRGTAAGGKVVLTLRGRARGLKRFPAALDSGRAPAGCGDLAGLLGKRLKGPADVKALGPVLAAKLCGKPAPAGAAGVLAKLALGAPPAPAPTGLQPGGAPTAPRGGTPTPPRATPTPTPAPPAGKRVCDNGADDDGDGQTDWEDPGCSDAGDSSENSEVPVSAACAASAGVGMADDPTELGAGVNGDCGKFYAVEVAVAPGIAACTANNGYECTVFDPIADASVGLNDPERDMVDVTMVLKGPVRCDTPYTMAFHRRNGEVAELRAPVNDCKTLPAPPPKCSNGKDDDGDGMVDSRDAPGVTDPDPGCTSPADTSENSETPSPEWCDIELAQFNNDARFTGLTVEGCGVITGVWFKPPGTPTDCFFQIGSNDAQTCAVKGGTAGATFAATNQGVALATHIPADPACAPVTVALVHEDGSVWGDRVRWC